MKKFMTSVLFLALISNISFAETIWADDSINDVIIKQYDANALRDEYLPVLPDSLKNENNAASNIPKVEPQKPVLPPPKTVVQTKSQAGTQKAIKPVNKNDYVFVKRGTKFRLRIEQPIDDSANIGSKIYFTSLYPEVNKYITIPSGTRFIGTVQDSHMPQISANGGLLVISIDEFIYKGKRYPIESKVVMVGNKRIFQNNIKGKHTYWKSVAKSTKPGRKFYAKSWNLTKKYAGDGLEVILTPITFVGGVTVLAANTVASPFVALFSKGGRLFIKKGTRFQIKLQEDTAVYL